MLGAAVYDHRVTVWRKTESRGGSLREVKRTWTEVGTEMDIPMAVQARRERREDGGPGEFVGGEYKGICAAGRDIQEGDVVELKKGPESPATLEVDSAYSPRNHHTELVLVSWQGELP